MTEAVRLVIWDLDETFWHGTLSEGGIRYDRRAHDCVIKLAQRGIVSSICSKNDHDAAKSVLVEHGIWDYFVFPSINWEAKGQRIKSIVERMQLRPATVMFIDDNPLNLGEARHYVPDINISDETIIPRLAEQPCFRGKDDSGLTRLMQYRILERRQGDAAESGGDNREFLRASRITVTLVHDIEPHLDRAIELINRTNQLNYTKRRLPEEIEAARQTLREQLSHYNVQAALIGVADKYGDYGFCGYYAMTNTSRGARLTDFCFSCRILNMGVEQWIYEKLGRPRLKIEGEVATKLSAKSGAIDWIGVGGSAQGEPAAAASLGRVLLRGGCDLMPLATYFGPSAAELITEFNIVRDGIPIRIDHSTMLRLALVPPTTEMLQAVAPLGYRAEDFRTQVNEARDVPPVLVLSFGMDSRMALYRHRELGFHVPLWITSLKDQAMHADLTKLDASELPSGPRGQLARELIAELREHYDYEGISGGDLFRDNLAAILDAIPPGARIFIILLNERRRAGTPGARLAGAATLNGWIKAVASGRADVELLPIRDFVHEESEVDANPGHFNRIVYYRMAQHILARVAPPPATATE